MSSLCLYSNLHITKSGQRRVKNQRIRAANLTIDQNLNFKSRLVVMSSQGGKESSEKEKNSDQVELPLKYTPDGRLPVPTKLSFVVEDAVRRWYLETEKEAQRGDIKAQALLGQMLMEGYGCDADPAKGREHAEKARRRGYRMQGVYCEI